MNALALDLGTKTGYALHQTAKNVVAGTWVLGNAKTHAADKAEKLDRRGDSRVIGLFHTLREQHRNTPLDFVFFEDVQFSSSTAQTQLWSSFRTAVWLAGHLCGFRIECCPVGTLKKFASGSGAAEKSGMAYSLVKKYPRRFSLSPRGKGRVMDREQNVELDDNAVDAFHLLYWGLDLVRFIIV